MSEKIVQLFGSLVITISLFAGIVQAMTVGA
jgi:hypothetical protein